MSYLCIIKQTEILTLKKSKKMENYELIVNLEFRSLIRNIRRFKEDFNSERLFETLENKETMLEWAKEDLEKAKNDIENIIDSINNHITILNIKSQKGGIKK